MSKQYEKEDLIFDRTLFDVQEAYNKPISENLKGAYNAEDLNRISMIGQRLTDMLEEQGVLVEFKNVVVYDWKKMNITYTETQNKTFEDYKSYGQYSKNTVLWKEDFETILHNISIIIGFWHVKSYGTYGGINNFNYLDANSIEHALYDACVNANL